MNKNITANRRTLLAWTASATLFPYTRLSLAAAVKRPVVVELFTSEGCSSCPPADAFLNELAAQPSLIALSLHVDYWDYLGWRDTLALAESTKRQRDYAQRRKDNRVYTPQIIVNGLKHVVGSRQGDVQAIIAEEQKRQPAEFVGMTIKAQGEELVVDLEAAPLDHAVRQGTLWVLAVAPKLVVTVGRGENAGRTMTYRNVVRRLIPAGMWHGEARSLTLPLPDVLPDPSLGCAAILQADDAGPILGAAWLDAASPS
jgi:hypothetical protein